MMQAFDALIAGQRAGSTRNSGSEARTPNAQDDAASGGFDRMLQAQGSRGVAPKPVSRGTGSPDAPTQAKTRESAPRAPEESKAAESRAKDASRETARTEAQDGAPREANEGDRECDTASTTAEDTTASDTAEPASATTVQVAATPALPEQMLALLSGLAGASAAPAAATPAATTEALPPGVLRGDAAATDPRGGDANAAVLPSLAGAQNVAVAPTDGDATAAFAMAMGAASPGGTKTADPADATLDTTAIGETTPTSLPPVSTMTNHPLSRAAAAAVQANAPIALDNGFEDGFSSRIAWMADQKVGHAEIRITPDHLGAIDVRLQVDGNRVNAEFHSAQPDVRHALESSLPRLKEMLGQQGLQLGQADVGQRQAQQQASNGSASTLAGGNERGEAANDAGWTRVPVARASRGLLDEYA